MTNQDKSPVMDEGKFLGSPPPDANVDGQLLEVSMGPQHPSTHGVFRMDVVLDGERVVKLKPVFGYLHRNHEKIAEGTSYLASIPYTDRLDYFCSMTNNWAYCLAVEKLAGLPPAALSAEISWRSRWARSILRRTACSGWTSFWMASAWFG